MLSQLGIDGRRDIALFIAMTVLIAITPIGEGTNPLVLVGYRLMLVLIAILCFDRLRHSSETNICPGFIGLCALAIFMMWISMAWNAGSPFDAYYRWYQHLFFGAAFLLMAAFHRRRHIGWKRSVLWMIIGVEIVYVLGSLIIGQQPLIGPFINPNYFASFMLVGFCGSAALALFEKQWLQRLIAAGSALFLYYGMTQAWSRGATLSAAIVAVIGIIRFSRERRLSKATVSVAIACLLIAGALASPSLIRKFTDRGQFDPYNYQRPQLWMSALRVIQQNPVLGVGFGQFYFLSKQFSPPVEGTIARYLKRPGIAHSEYLQYAAEIGIPGALLLFTLAGYTLFIALKRARSCPVEQRVYQEAAILTAIGVGVHALVDNNWTVPVVAASLVMFSLGDVLPSGSLNFRFHWPRQLRVAAAMGLALMLIHGVLIPGTAIYFNDAGHDAYVKGDLNRAESLHRLAAALIPNHDVFLDNAGMVYLDKSVTSNDRRWMFMAETLFRQAIAVNPNSDTPGRHLETLLIQQLTGNPERDREIHLKIAAIDRHILAIDPYNPFVRKNLAESLYYSGLKEAAQEELRRAIELEPNYIPAYLRISDWFRDAGDLSASDDYRQRALAVATRFQNFQTEEPYEAMLLGRPLASMRIHEN